MAGVDEEERVHLNPDEPTDPYQLYAVGGIPKKAPGVVRIWVDGCFDMMHFGHANALRQSKALGHELIVGIHSDEEVMRHKGPPIMTAEERYEAARACKWVLRVVENYPYVTRLKDMERFEVDYVAHGDDLSVGLDGRNSYQEIIDAGRFKVVKRTDGISTTDLVGRMLLCTKTHQVSSPTQPPEEMQSGVSLARYLTTTQKIVQFSNNKAPQPGDTIVYVEGAFDLFHVGHVHILKQARKMGTYVIVGLTEDEAVNKVKGRNFPIMNINERVLGVLSCKYVDEVIMGVPYEVTADIIEKLNINVVVAGKIREDDYFGGDPYAVPKEKGILREVDSPSALSTQSVIDRLIKNRAEYEDRQRKKVVKDKTTMENRPDEYKNVREI